MYNMVNCVKKQSFSATALVSFSVALDSREHQIDQKIWWEAEVQNDVCQNCDPYWQKWKS